MTALREFIKRRPGSALALGAVVTVAVALALAHTGPVAHEMGDDSADHGSMTASICLAVIGLGVGLLAATRAGRRVRLRRLRAPRRVNSLTGCVPLGTAAPVPVTARAGPARLQVFLR